MDQDQDSPVPENAGAGPNDEGGRPSQLTMYRESESLDPDESQADPAVTAVTA